MFDFAWTEIGLIAAVALILIGPKDMPVAIRAVTDMVKKARRMAAEFQTHVDEMVREANLDEVRNQISDIRNFDIRAEVERAVDPDGSLRSTFTSNPLEPTSAETAAAPLEEVAVAELPAAALVEPAPAPETVEDPTPAFVPPRFAAATPANCTDVEPPAFIPPAVVLQTRSPGPH